MRPLTALAGAYNLKKGFTTVWEIVNVGELPGSAVGQYCGSFSTGQGWRVPVAGYVREWDQPGFTEPTAGSEG